MVVDGAAGSLSGEIDELVLVLTRAMDLDEGEKLYHCWRVAVIVDRLAALHPDTHRPEAFLAGLLHDVGGIGAPLDMLNYIREPDESMTSEVLQHPHKGAEFVRAFPGLRGRQLIADIILQHHEHWDGSGFPNGLAGDEILPESLLVRAADEADSLSLATERPRRQASTLAKLRRRGTVPPHLVDSLGKLFGDRSLLEMLRDETKLQAEIHWLYGVHREKLMEQVRGDRILEGLFALTARAIDTKHRYTYGHSTRMAMYAEQTGERMNLCERELGLLRYGGLVHDLGKLGVPRQILMKPGKLNPDEWELMRNHARATWDSLRAFRSLQVFSFAALHHERWDGKGYPFGLVADEIPPLSRILAVADSLDAMTSARPYRRVWTFQRAMDEISKHAGSQFDPEVVKAAREIHSERPEA